MKVGASELFEVVRQVVREEVRKVLPAMVAKHLSEAYIRNALRESLGQAGEPPRRDPRPNASQARLPANLREIIAGTDPDDEVTPEALPNDTRGIYEPANPLVKPQNEVVTKLLSRDNPMAHIYEGLSPIDQSAPVDKLPAGLDLSKMNALVAGLERSASTKKPTQLSEDAQMKELERKRRMLDVPARNLPKVS